MYKTDMHPTIHVQCTSLAKSFGSVQALRNASLRVRSGRIVALVGENGAGKSTLMQLISGDLEADTGQIEVNTRVGLVRQQLSTIGELTLLENIVFGAERTKGKKAWTRLVGGIDWRSHRAQISELMEQTGLAVPLKKLGSEVSVGIRQRTDLLTALYQGAQCLLLDEPTTYLTPHEVDSLFDLMRGLAAEGMGVVFISHRLREVVQHCDEVNVLRRGESVLHLDTRPFDLPEIGQAMSGTAAEPSAESKRAPRDPQEGAVRLEAARGKLRVRAGEIVGIAGVAGNGQQQLLNTIAGIDQSRSHLPVLLDGVDASGISAGRRRSLGLRFVPESVKESGVAPLATITDNLLTANPPSPMRGPLGVLHRRAAETAASALITDAEIVASGPRQRAGELSGGNLQRVAVARELAGEARLLLAHEPTRGVDFGGVALIHRRLLDFTHSNGAVLLVTSDLDELLSLSDRVHVIDRGRLSGSYERSELSLGRLGELLGGLELDQTRSAAS